MVDEKTRAAAHEALTDYIAARKLRRTPERFAILDKACDMVRLFGVDELYNAIETDGYHVSRTTIYNTLDLLVDAGIVRCHRFGELMAQYELTGPTTPLHLICTQCGAVKEIKDPELTAYLDKRSYPAFHPAYYRLYVHGLCATCSRRNRRSRKKPRT